MDYDAEKLVAAIEVRPLIYNFTLKEYKNRNLVEKAWEEVAAEFNLPVADCKTKWASIRNSYNRALRENENQPSWRKGVKRKKWYMMDTLEFLRDFTGTHRKSVNNLHPGSTDDEMDTLQEGSQESGKCLSNSAMSTTTPTPPSAKTEISSIKKEIESKIDFLKNRTETTDKESSTLSFFKGIVEEVDSLPLAKRTTFKVDVMNLLGNYVQQEQDC